MSRGYRFAVYGLIAATVSVFPAVVEGEEEASSSPPTVASQFREIGDALNLDSNDVTLLAKTFAPYLENRPAEYQAKVLMRFADLYKAGVDPIPAMWEAIRTQEQIDQAAKEGEGEGQKKEAQKNFLGVDWSFGLGLGYDWEGDRITAARVVGGIVRVDEEKRATPRILLDLHYFFRYPGDRLSKDDRKTLRTAQPGVHYQNAAAKKEALSTDILRGWGPFVAVQSSNNQVVDAFALGVMFGWRRDPNKSQSFNLGLGVILDPSVQVLAEGFKPGKPLPAGETDVRFKKEDRWGAVVVASFSFF